MPGDNDGVHAPDAEVYARHTVDRFQREGQAGQSGVDVDTAAGDRQLVADLDDGGDVVDGFGHGGAGGGDDDRRAVAAPGQFSGEVVDVHRAARISVDDHQRHHQLVHQRIDLEVAGSRGEDDAVGVAAAGVEQGVFGAFGGTTGDIAPPARRCTEQVGDGIDDLDLDVTGVVAAMPAAVVWGANVVEQHRGQQVRELRIGDVGGAGKADIGPGVQPGLIRQGGPQASKVASGVAVVGHSRCP